MQTTSCNPDKSEKAFMDGLKKDTMINFPEISEKLTISARVWGISGDHEEVSISKSDAAKSDTTTKEVFFTSKIFFRRSGTDSLIVYAPYSSIKINTKDQIGGVKLIVRPLTTGKDIIDFEKNHIAKGLSYINAYY